MDIAVRVAVGEVIVEESQQLQHLLREFVVGVVVPTQGRGGGLICARRSSDPQVNPPWGKCVQHAELFGDHERRVVRQHHPACAESNLVCLADQSRQHQLRR